MKRQMLIPVVAAGGAWSWLTTLLHPSDQQDRDRRQNWWGWTDALLDQHWCRLLLTRPETVSDPAYVAMVTGGTAPAGAVPVTDEGWSRLLAAWREEGWYHRLKNVGSEWARLDEQRAYKAAAFVAGSLFGLGCLIGVGISLLMQI